MVALYQNSRNYVHGAPVGTFDKSRNFFPKQRLMPMKRGTNVPYAYIFTGTGPGNGDTLCTRYEILCNADGTIQYDFLGRPNLDTATATVTGAPSPPSSTNRAISIVGTNRISISNWVGGPRDGRWVSINSTTSITGLASGLYYAVNSSGNSCQLATTRGGTPVTFPATSNTSTAVTVREEIDGLDALPEGDCTFISDSAGQTRDYLIVLPMDEWGLNPQRSQPLQKPGGIYIQKGYRVVYSGKITHDIDYVALLGGVGFNVAAATPTMKDSGGGYHDELNRAVRASDWGEVCDMRGLTITGKYLYEGVDVSNTIAAGAALGSGLTANPIFNYYWNKVGDSTNWIKNLQVRTVASQASMLGTSNTNPGDIFDISGSNSWRYNGGTRSSLSSYTDLGRVIEKATYSTTALMTAASGTVPGNIFKVGTTYYQFRGGSTTDLNNYNNLGTSLPDLYANHSGGDCLQLWGIVSCEVDVQNNEHHTAFQSIFIKWNDVLTSTQVNSGVGPNKVTIAGNKTYGYGAVQSGYLIYVTGAGISGQTQSAVKQPPIYMPRPNTVSATYSISDPRALFRVFGQSPTSGTATQSNGFYRYVDLDASEKAAYNVVQSCPRPFRYMIKTNVVGSQGFLYSPYGDTGYGD